MSKEFKIIQAYRPIITNSDQSIDIKFKIVYCANIVFEPFVISVEKTLFNSKKNC